MNCPICSQEMNDEKRTTYNNRELKEYLSHTYHCNKDDVWITLEIPKDKFKELS